MHTTTITPSIIWLLKNNPSEKPPNNLNSSEIPLSHGNIEPAIVPSISENPDETNNILIHTENNIDPAKILNIIEDGNVPLKALNITESPKNNAFKKYNDFSPSFKDKGQLFDYDINLLKSFRHNKYVESCKDTLHLIEYSEDINEDMLFLNIEKFIKDLSRYGEKIKHCEYSSRFRIWIIIPFAIDNSIKVDVLTRKANNLKNHIKNRYPFNEVNLEYILIFSAMHLVFRNALDEIEKSADAIILMHNNNIRSFSKGNILFKDMDKLIDYSLSILSSLHWMDISLSELAQLNNDLFARKIYWALSGSGNMLDNDFSHEQSSDRMPSNINDAFSLFYREFNKVLNDEFIILLDEIKYTYTKLEQYESCDEILYRINEIMAQNTSSNLIESLKEIVNPFLNEKLQFSLMLEWVSPTLKLFFEKIDIIKLPKYRFDMELNNFRLNLESIIKDVQDKNMVYQHISEIQNNKKGKELIREFKILNKWDNNNFKFLFVYIYDNDKATVTNIKIKYFHTQPNKKDEIYVATSIINEIIKHHCIDLNQIFVAQIIPFFCDLLSYWHGSLANFNNDSYNEIIDILNSFICFDENLVLQNDSFQRELLSFILDRCKTRKINNKANFEDFFKNILHNLFNLIDNHSELNSSAIRSDYSTVIPPFIVVPDNILFITPILKFALLNKKYMKDNNIINSFEMNGYKTQIKSLLPKDIIKIERMDH